VTHTVSNPSSQQLRHRCRNPRCRSKLPAPVENLYAAFCTLGCWNQFHRQRCVVCERLFRRATENQLTCGRRKCRLELRRQTALYLPFQAGGTLPTLDVNAPHGSAHSTGLKTRLTGDRPWRIVAGPALPEINLQIPLEPEVIARLVRVHADYLEYERKRHWHTARAAQIKRRHPPVNVLGGFRFPDVPAVELGPVKTPESEWAVPSRWKPTGDGADIPDIPQFLRRGSGRAPAPTTIVIAWGDEISKTRSSSCGAAAATCSSRSAPLARPSRRHWHKRKRPRRHRANTTEATMANTETDDVDAEIMRESFRKILSEIFAKPEQKKPHTMNLRAAPSPKGDQK
jgi:hypothetical protein